MKVCVDIAALAGRPSGIRGYVSQITRFLLSGIGGHRYTLYGPHVRDDPFPDLPKELRIDYGWWRLLALEHSARRGRASRLPPGHDVYHVPHPAPPPAIGNGARLVVTVHDLAFLHFPETVADRGFFRHLVRAVSEQVAAADAILVDSVSTADEVRRVYGVTGERLTVVYPGYSEDVFHPGGSEERCPTMRDAPESFILSVGTIEPRKNHLTLIEAFERFARATGAADVHLLLAGGLGWQYRPILQRIEDSPVRQRITHLPDLPSESLAALCRRAVCMAYPSLYEGFGIPVVEAMACGCPVVTSNVSSLPEVAGDAGILVDPRDAEGLAEALRAVWDDGERREHMRRAGIRQARRFTWRDAARRVAGVYEGRETPCGEPARGSRRREDPSLG